MKKPELPYLPLGWEVFYVPAENEWMKKARLAAGELSTDDHHPTGAVLVQQEKLIGRGANRSMFHKKIGCVRKFLRHLFPVPSGKMYWTCCGCSPRFHAEQSAIRDAQKKGHQTTGADLYLWGHWWCCESCWERIIDARVERVFLMEGAQDQFGQ
jgi:deoxycytidylate deaminase